MFKRVVWMGMGAVAGSASTVWAQRKVKTQLNKVSDKATPAHAIGVAKDRMADVRDTVVAAVNEGRAARADAETEMRQSVNDRWGPRPR